MAQIIIKDLIRQLHEIHEGSKWFDQCFRDKLDGLSAEDAFTNPIPSLHSVAEHVSHMLEWRKECINRYNGIKVELMHSPDDWKDNATLRKTGWAALKDAFFSSQADLIQLLEGRDDCYLETRFRDTEYNFHYLIEGIIQHDLYHMGQIGVTIKLLHGA